MRALITGASSGIGKALAILLAERGAELILVARNEEKLQKIVSEINVKESILADLLTQEGREKTIKAIEKHLPDLVVNNAGAGIYGEAIGSDVRKQMEILQLNAFAPLELTLSAAKIFLDNKKRSTILNVSSLAGEFPMPGMAVYGASKACMTKYSQALNFELSPKGIHVLVNCPGMVETDFSKKAGEKRRSRKGPVLSPELVAKQILDQVEKKQEKRIVGVYNRLLSFFVSRFIPVSAVEKKIWKSLQERL